ncbi:MAG: class I SAM-dependent DNA methyltransferase [Candidatus Moranbacteria bacterium]|nr:class I SAM-dependent DNA methyltransferase [Candidatus Moranbacteria bacterium]
MNLVTLQENLEDFSQNFSKETFLFDLLTIYAFPKSTISLLSKNPSKLSGKENQIILKNKVLFHITTLEEDEHVAIDLLQKDKSSYKFNPRFIIVTDFVTFLAIDTKTKETLDIKIEDLSKHYAFFLPWCGMEKSQHANENPADIRAAYKMDKLFQSIIKDNPKFYENNSHDLNIFLSRLLFCFFAEDTGIFEKDGIFTNLIDSQSSDNGDGLKELFLTLFEVLSTKQRSKFASHFLDFPYVNGGLFETKIELPIFTANSRKLIIGCGKLDWSSINPDIFGSMIQAVVHPGQRENLGMHYTSVPNIMKVIEPLFLNNLYDELEKSQNNFNKLIKLRRRISKIKIFDPACGSGNFLIISYKELCKLESLIIREMNLQNSFASLEGWNSTLSGITLNNFYGIEIDDFAHEIARLSLYLAQHQINIKFKKEFGNLKPTLPLRESGKIVCANATRVDWNEVCPRADKATGEYEIYVVGNPPYLGSRNQENEQKEDLKSLFEKDYKSLDYISAWFYKGAKYISGYEKIKLALVSTNSISQGLQVSLLWPRVFNEGVEICFAHQSFKWKNLAKGNAGVTCVIIGLANPSQASKKIYFDNKYIEAKHINAYLVDGDNIYIESRSKPISNFTEMNFGNMPADGGKLLFTQDEKIDFLQKEPRAEKYFRKIISADEFLNGKSRFCLWLVGISNQELESLPYVKNRVDELKKIRLASSRPQLANIPHLFAQITQDENVNHIVVPGVSSENRKYIPIGIIGKGEITTNSCFIVPLEEKYLFAVLTSYMHMVWIKSVGGKLETRYRYSKDLVYNTFPFPNITPKQKESLTSHVYNILEEREKYPEKTMADLYDPDKMPDGLREAHKYLDLAIDQIYRSKPFESDEDRLAHLFKLYEEMISREINK